MSYYRVCSYCGSALDLGERCDCQNEKAAPVLEHRDGKKGNKLTKACYPLSLPKNKEDCQV